MSEGNRDNNGAPTDEVKKFSQAEVEAMIEKETGGLKSKVDELLGEKKREQQARKEFEEKARHESEERARRDKDFESLFNSSEKKKAEFEQKYNDLLNSVKTEKVGNAAMKLASELADGDNADLLSTFVKSRLTMVEDKIVVTDIEGNPTVSTLDDLKKEFSDSGRYNSLLRQTKADAGRAGAQSKASGLDGKKSYDDLTQDEKLAYFRNKREG